MSEDIFTVGIVGHCDLGGEDVDFYVQMCCHKLLSELRIKYPKIRAISAISQGADSIFAESAVSLNIPLESIIPFANFKSDFTEEVPLERYKKLRESADFETAVNFSKRSDLAYKKSMEWVIFKSNIVIAVWDGKKIGSIGGTWEAVLICRNLNKKMINIDIHNKTMSLYFSERNNYFFRKNISAKHLGRYI